MALRAGMAEVCGRIKLELRVLLGAVRAARRSRANLPRFTSKLLHHGRARGRADAARSASAVARRRLKAPPVKTVTRAARRRPPCLLSRHDRTRLAYSVTTSSSNWSSDSGIPSVLPEAMASSSAAFDGYRLCTITSVWLPFSFQGHRGDGASSSPSSLVQTRRVGGVTSRYRPKNSIGGASPTPTPGGTRPPRARPSRRRAA